MEVFARAHPAAAADPALEASLRSAVEVGRRTWPGVSIPAEAFVEHLARHAPAEVALPEWLSTLHAADLYLACACAAGDPAAITAFDDAYLARVPIMSGQSRAPAPFAAEVRQALRVRLLVREGEVPGRIAEYAGRGPLAGWLRVAASRTAISLRRSDDVHERRRADGPPPVLAMIDPELAAIQRKYGSMFNDALRSAFDALSADQRTVLRLHFVDGLNLADIGRVLGASRATIGRRVLEARNHLYDRTATTLRARLGVSDKELESLLAVVRSKLDISLQSVLPPS